MSFNKEKHGIRETNLPFINAQTKLVHLSRMKKRLYLSVNYIEAFT